MPSEFRNACRKSESHLSRRGLTSVWPPRVWIASTLLLGVRRLTGPALAMTGALRLRRGPALVLTGAPQSWAYGAVLCPALGSWAGHRAFARRCGRWAHRAGLWPALGQPGARSAQREHAHRCLPLHARGHLNQYEYAGARGSSRGATSISTSTPVPAAPRGHLSQLRRASDAFGDGVQLVALGRRIRPLLIVR
jgi:hypothetical protein